jgi:hypothetical protein
LEYILYLRHSEIKRARTPLGIVVLHELLD